VNYRSLITLAVLCLAKSTCYAPWFPKMNRKGNMVGGWGWNRAAFTDSDIHFSGKDYNFTLYKVVAKDRQTPFSADTYFGLYTMTIPQTNIRGGYFITDNIVITAGVDHMKYVMVQDQAVGFSGNISDATFGDMVHDGRVKLTDQFLTYEHTDGLNYLNAEVEYFQGIYHSRRFQLNCYAGIGAGALMPKSNVKLMGYPRNDQFHLAGYGTDIKLGLEFLFLRHFFIRLEGKSGFINMPDVVTRKASVEDRASQHFFFVATDGMFGFNIPLTRKVRDVANPGVE
jgi:hypothetical protein